MACIVLMGVHRYDSPQAFTLECVVARESSFQGSQELNGRDCSADLKDKLVIPLKERFLIFPVLHGPRANVSGGYHE